MLCVCVCVRGVAMVVGLRSDIECFCCFGGCCHVSINLPPPTVHTPNMNIGNRVPNLNRKIKTIGILRLVNITTTRWVNRRVEWNRINLICNVMGARSEVGNQIKCAVEQQKARENTFYNKYLWDRTQEEEGCVHPGYTSTVIYNNRKTFL